MNQIRYVFTQPQGSSITFAFGEPYTYDVVINFPSTKYVLSGFQNYDKGGSDEYMFNQGKIGFGVELGSKEHPEKFFSQGIAIAQAFLYHYGHSKNDSQKLLQMQHQAPENEPEQKNAEYNGRIVFLRQDVEVGDDTFYLFKREEI